MVILPPGEGLDLDPIIILCLLSLSTNYYVIVLVLCIGIMHIRCIMPVNLIILSRSSIGSRECSALKSANRVAFVDLQGYGLQFS